ncbi:hypothetical protein ACIRRI_06870 [Streptomyces mirabilis]|uniref:hypothetical protein n=1 Tax=Streptomyces mirabilis TaxID=68239 RepID=UPI0037FBAB0F
MPLDLRGTADLPVCRFHGTHCRLGDNWPIERPPEPFDALLDLRAAGREKLGLPAEPHPRDVWQTDRHEKVPKSELRERRQEIDQAVAVQRAKNDQILAELRDERAATEGN